MDNPTQKILHHITPINKNDDGHIIINNNFTIDRNHEVTCVGTYQYTNAKNQQITYNDDILSNTNINYPNIDPFYTSIKLTMASNTEAKKLPKSTFIAARAWNNEHNIIESIIAKSKDIQQQTAKLLQTMGELEALNQLHEQHAYANYWHTPDKPYRLHHIPIHAQSPQDTKNPRYYGRSTIIRINELDNNTKQHTHFSCRNNTTKNNIHQTTWRIIEYARNGFDYTTENIIADNLSYRDAITIMWAHLIDDIPLNLLIQQPNTHISQHQQIAIERVRQQRDAQYDHIMQTINSCTNTQG